MHITAHDSAHIVQANSDLGLGDTYGDSQPLAGTWGTSQTLASDAGTHADAVENVDAAEHFDVTVFPSALAGLALGAPPRAPAHHDASSNLTSLDRTGKISAQSAKRSLAAREQAPAAAPFEQGKKHMPSATASFWTSQAEVFDSTVDIN